MTDRKETKEQDRLIIGHGLGTNRVDRIRYARTLRGLSRERLAHKAGVCINTVERIENMTIWPRLDSCQRICEVLGISLSDGFEYYERKGDKK